MKNRYYLPLLLPALAVMVGGCSYPEGTIPTAGRMIPNVPVIQSSEHDGHEYILAWSANGVSVVHSASCPCHHQVAQTLSEWDKLILAISYTESRWNPDAVGSNHDSGHLQLTGPYLSEINRIYKTNYTLEDAFDPETAIKLFTMMQEHYNKEHDIQSAIYHHNKASYYRDAVMENMALVERYEAIRKILIEYEHK